MTTTTAKPATEINRRLRGHRFTAPQADLRTVPALYATEQVDTADKVARLHYFTGPFDWYVVEMSQETGEAFGLTVNRATGERELGYMSLSEMEAVRVGYRVIERDMYWTPVTLAAVDPIVLAGVNR